jgi:hypothetical protein
MNLTVGSGQGKATPGQTWVTIIPGLARGDASPQVKQGVVVV